MSSLYEGNTKDPKCPSTREEYSPIISTNTSIQIQQSSFDSNVTTQDTTKNQDENKDKQSHDDKIKNKSNSFSETFLNNNNTNDNNIKNKSKKGGFKTNCFKAPQPPTYSFRKSGQASQMFRNLITCGTANTHEKALVVIDKRKTCTTSRVSSVSKMHNGKENDMGRICKEQKLRGFEKSFDTSDGSKKSKKEESYNNFKAYGAAYRPVNGPKCSQCGRQFKPEKLHNHMRYCRGTKAMAKSTNSRPKPKTSTPHSPSTTSLDTLYLTNN